VPSGGDGGRSRFAGVTLPFDFVGVSWPMEVRLARSERPGVFVFALGVALALSRFASKDAARPEMHPGPLAAFRLQSSGVDDEDGLSRRDTLFASGLRAGLPIQTRSDSVLATGLKRTTFFGVVGVFRSFVCVAIIAQSPEAQYAIGVPRN
jgi:hypothetical protein